MDKLDPIALAAYVKAGQGGGGGADLSAYRTAAAQDAIDNAKLDKSQGTGNAGKVLTVGADGMVTPQDAAGGDNVFFAEYGVTTSAEVEAAIAGGKLVALKRGGMIYTLTETHKMGAISVYHFASLRKDYYAIIELSNDRWYVVNNNSPIGTYSKPESGIPKTDLDSDVQTSLGKADTALQQHQDISGKLDKNQGVAHADEFLVVGSDGNVTTQAMSNAETEAL